MPQGSPRMNVLMAAADGAIMAGPDGARPPTLDGGQWTWPSYFRQRMRRPEWFASHRRGTDESPFRRGRWHAGERARARAGPRKTELAAKKNNNLPDAESRIMRRRSFRKIFLDFNEHFGNHDLVIALRTTVLTRYWEIVQLPQGN